MAELASSMTGLLLPNHFQPLDQDSESDDESIEYGSSIQIPFSSMSDTSNTSPRSEVKSTSPNVTVEYLPHMDLKHRTSESWNHMDSSVLTNDSGFTPNSSGFSADLSSIGGLSSLSSSCNASFNSKIASMSRGESFRTQELSVNTTTDSLHEMEQPVTPTKLLDTNQVCHDDPLTPTANLKMLLSAMSPEIRNLENKKKKARLFDAMVEAASVLPGNEVTISSSNQVTVLSDKQGAVSPSDHTSTLNSSSGHDSSFLASSQDENVGEDGEKNNRKAKSLGLLCQKFLTKYPDYPKDGKAMDISLDQISKDLSVERRRIYDIVNVLESVEMVSRRAKNRYLWHGRTHLNRTLAKLKCLGQRQKFAEQLALLQSRLEDGSLSMDDTKSPTYGPDRVVLGEVAKQPFQDISNFLRSPVDTEFRKDGRENWEDDTKRDKTLGVMSQKFIMLFLVCKDRIISLDVAARILKGDQNYQIGENAKFKTKVRRLYDIANILTSLKLIDKIHLSEGRSRKPAFRWIGPDPDTSHVDWSQLPTGTKPTQKHSYFPLPPVNSDSWSSNPTHKQSPAMIKLPLGKLTPIKSPRVNWSRNASFSAICEVAEQECRKYSSAPNSPVKKEEEDDGENESPPIPPNGAKKEEDFIQEFQALRNKYPACVSRLFSTTTTTSSDPSPLTSDPMPLTPDPLKLSPIEAPRVTRVEVCSPRGQAGEAAGSASRTKAQKVVYVQRFVPLLNANTIAAVQASSSAQTDTTNPTILAGNRTIVSPNGALVDGPRPVVTSSPTPGSVVHLLPMRQENWVQLPHGNDFVSRNAINGSQHPSVSSGPQPESAASCIKSPLVPNSSQVVTIIRRSKRAVKLALDKEFEYHPLIKKAKAADKPPETAHIQNPATKVTVSEPAKNSTVIIAHPTPLVTLPEGPHPQAHTPAPHPATHPLKNNNQVAHVHDAKNMIGNKSVIQETPLVRSDVKLRRAALKRVKRRLTIDLDKAPTDETQQAPKTTADSNTNKGKKASMDETEQAPKHRADSGTNTGKKMPRCYSLSELDTRKGDHSRINGLVVPYLETSGELHSIPREIINISLDESKRIRAICVSQEHNYSSNSVKMKFGGKFGSLTKSVEDAKVDNHDTASDHITKGHDDDGKKKLKETVCAASAVKSTCQKAEQKIVEMGGNANLEDCWLSASFPPPTLSGFSTFLQGRTSRGTPHPGSSRPSSVVSIGELDRWLFPAENASPTVAIGQAVKTVSTPWVLSPTITISYSSPPKLTTKASPAGHGVALASPRPVLPQTNSHLYLSPHHSIRDPSLEPLYTSTPKSPKTGSRKYISSDLTDSQSVMESVSYSGDETTPCQPIPYPQDAHKDLGRLKPLDGTPIELQCVPAVELEGVNGDQPDTGHSCSVITSVQKFPLLPPFADEPKCTVVSTSSSQTSSLPPYLMCSTTAIAASRVVDPSPHLQDKSSVDPAYICSSGHRLVSEQQTCPTVVPKPTDLPICDPTKDNTPRGSPPFMLQEPTVQLPVPPPGETIEVPTELFKPLPCLQSLPKFPRDKPAITSGLISGLPRVWGSSSYSMQQSSRILLPPQLTSTSDSTAYIAHAGVCAGNPKAPETSCGGCRPPLKIYPRSLANTFDRSLFVGPHLLDVHYRPAPGGLPSIVKSNNILFGRDPLGAQYPQMDHEPAALGVPRLTVPKPDIMGCKRDPLGGPYSLPVDDKLAPPGVPRLTEQNKPTPDTNKQGNGPVNVGVPCPLVMDHGLGSFPRFTVERIPTPGAILTNGHRSGFVSHLNAMNAQGLCSSNAAVPVPLNPPLTNPNPIVERAPVSSNHIPASRQINCHHIITSG